MLQPLAARLRSAPSDTELALLRVAHRQNLPTLIVHVAASTGVFAATWRQAPAWSIAWLAAVLIVCLVRLSVHLHLGRALDQAPPPGRPVRTWATAHAVGLIFSAGLWVVLVIARLPGADVQTAMTIVIVISALSGGAIGVLAPLLITGRIYVSLLLLPASALLLVGGQPILGILGMIFWGVMMAGHRANHQLLVRAITLSDENARLAETLLARTREVEQANVQLESRVAARTEELQDMALKAEAANRVKSEFLATISHEIRTPLNGVIGMAQVMSRDGLAPRQAERLSIIRTSAQALLDVLNDVLDISKIESGAMEIRPVVFDLAEFAEGIGRVYQPLAEERGLAFVLTISQGARGLRRGDLSRLRQIVSNLVSNALKFTEQGEVRVAFDGDAATLLCTVTDTGMGIAADKQHEVFERFVQADGSNTRRAGGTGLGLAISQELAHLMGGKIGLTSALGAGSRLELTLPIGLADPGEAPEPQAAAPQAAAVRCRRVLIVDDNATNRMVMQTLLEELHIASEVAADGREAIAAWQDQPWDAILMDIHMPEMDGLEATRRIRAREQESQRPRTPILAVTASVMSHETQAYMAAGMDAVVPKPVDLDELVACLNRVIRPEPA